MILFSTPPPPPDPPSIKGVTTKSSSRPRWLFLARPDLSAPDIELFTLLLPLVAKSRVRTPVGGPAAVLRSEGSTGGGGGVQHWDGRGRRQIWLQSWIRGSDYLSDLIKGSPVEEALQGLHH